MSDSQEPAESPELAFLKKMRQFGATTYTLASGRYQGRERVTALHICGFPDGVRQALEFRSRNDPRYGTTRLEPTRKHFHEKDFRMYEEAEQLTLHAPMELDLAIKKGGRPDFIRAHLARLLLPKKEKNLASTAA